MCSAYEKILKSNKLFGEVVNVGVNSEISIKNLIVKISKILKINKGTLKIGSDADICVFDLDAPWIIKADLLKSKSKNTAVEGRKIQGKVLMTFLKGDLAFKSQ